MNNSLNRYNKKTFLIVDDFSEFRLSLKQMLIGIGAHHIDMVGNGEEAIEAYCETQHDILLIDFNLGEGINGLQVLEELSNRQSLRKDTIVVLITAETASNVVMGMLEHRPDEYLAKPFTKSTLKSRIDRSFVRKEALRPILQTLNSRSFKKAIALCDILIKEKNKYSVDCLKIKAESLCLLGLPNHAKQIYQHVLQSREVNWAQIGLAQTELMGANYANCIKLCDQIIAKNQLTVEAYDLKAEALYHQGEKEQAFEVVTKAIEISPNTAHRQRTFGLLNMCFEQYEAAARAFRKTIQLAADSINRREADTLYLLRALHLHSLHGSGPNARRATQELQRVAKQAPSTFPGNQQFELAIDIHILNFLIQSKQTDKACKLINRLKASLSELESDIKFWLVNEVQFLVEQYPEDTDISSILDCCGQGADVRNFINEDPIAAGEYNHHGIQYFKEKNIGKALDCFVKAFQQAPSNLNIMQNFLQGLTRALELTQPKDDWLRLYEQCKQLTQYLPFQDKRSFHIKSQLQQVKQLLSKQTA